MKKLLLLLLSMLMMFSLVACGEEEDKDDKEDTKVEENEDKDSDDKDSDDEDSDDEDDKKSDEDEDSDDEDDKKSDEDEDDKKSEDDEDEDSDDEDDKKSEDDEDEDDADAKDGDVITTDIEGTDGVIGTIKETAKGDTSKYNVEYEVDGVKHIFDFEGPAGLSGMATESMGMVMFGTEYADKMVMIMEMDMTSSMSGYDADSVDEYLDEINGYSDEEILELMDIEDEFDNVSVSKTDKGIKVVGDMTEDGSVAAMHAVIEFDEKIVMSMYMYMEDESTYDADVANDMLSDLSE